MKNCIILHGCADSEQEAFEGGIGPNQQHWIAWLKNELVANDIPTQNPLMPSSRLPNYEKFKTEFEKYSVNKDTILVGHSCSCSFLVQWLGETKQKVAKLILVAPWKIPNKGDTFSEEFYGYPIDKTIKDRIAEILMFTADDEDPEGKESLAIFHKVIDGKIIELKSHGHYTMEDMGTEEFPELLQSILTLT